MAWKTLDAEELTQPGWFWSYNNTLFESYYLKSCSFTARICLLQWEQDQAFLIPGIIIIISQIKAVAHKASAYESSYKSKPDFSIFPL